MKLLIAVSISAVNTFYDASSQEREFGLNHLTSVPESPSPAYGTVGVAHLRLHTLQYTRLVIFVPVNACVEIPTEVHSTVDNKVSDTV